MTRRTGTLLGAHYTFLLISRPVRLSLINVSDKFVEKIKTHIAGLMTFWV